MGLLLIYMLMEAKSVLKYQFPLDTILNCIKDVYVLPQRSEMECQPPCCPCGNDGGACSCSHCPGWRTKANEHTHTSHSSWLCRHCPRAFALGNSDIKTIQHPGTWSRRRDKVHTMSYLEKSLQVHFSPLKFWAATLLFLPGKTKRLSCILLHSFEKANFMFFTRVKVIWK